jgi:hypothetical protein
MFNSVGEIMQSKQAINKTSFQDLCRLLRHIKKERKKNK